MMNPSNMKFKHILWTIIVLAAIEAVILIRRNSGSFGMHSQDRNLAEYPGKILRSFRPQDGDVMVHLSMPHTSSSEMLTRLLSMHVDPPCHCNSHCNTTLTSPIAKCRCNCPMTSDSNHNWLYSSVTTPWENDNVVRLGHTELQANTELNDLENNGHRLFIVTMLRHPEKRFISEWWRAYTQGEIWPTTGSICGLPVSPYESTLCRMEASVEQMILNRSLSAIDPLTMVMTPKRLPVDYFLECGRNQAVNRQVAMLATFSKTTCPVFDGFSNWKSDMLNDVKFKRFQNVWKKHVRMAKLNLRELDFFGLAEHQELSYELFEWTFQAKLQRKSKQRVTTADRILRSHTRVYPEHLEKVRIVHRPEQSLYDFAEKLFFERVDFMKSHRN